MPTGAGKTTLFDVTIPYCMAEDPGSVLQLMQTAPDAAGYYDERMEPILLSVPELAGMINNLPRNKRRKGELVMPHMTYFCKGANRTELQRKSVRYVMADEAWAITHGLLNEARARLHGRWNGRIMIVSQGGRKRVPIGKDMVISELEEAWARTDRREYSMTCPSCGGVKPWQMRQLKWDDGFLREDGTIDELHVAQSVHYACPDCPATFRDEPVQRRDLADSSVYVPANLGAPATHRGWHAPAVAMLHERWVDLAMGWIRANISWAAGDRTPRRIFVQKRLAENWEDIIETPVVALTAGDYDAGDYIAGDIWPGETARFMTIDRQQDHFWSVVRAWQSDGASRLLFEGKILTVDQCRDIQLRYKVQDKLTFQDAGHASGSVYNDCARFGWTALHGDRSEGYLHKSPKRRGVYKFYSPPFYAQAPCGKRALYFRWSNEGVKDTLSQLRSGRGPSFEVPRGISAGYIAQMNSEVKKPVISPITKKTSERWVQLGSRPNHLWDCEAMQVAAALMMRVLAGTEVEVAESAAEAATAEPDES
jgi:hypothetical protein